MNRIRAALTATITAAVMSGILGAGEVRAAEPSARPLVTQPVDPAQRVRLAGNTRPEVGRATDLGRVPDALPLQHLQLLLSRPAEREQSFQRYLAELQDRQSPRFHHWLTAAQIAADYGPAPADIGEVTTWLAQQGFAVDSVHAESLLIDFTGTAGQVRQAFRTELHALRTRSGRHLANVSDPTVPAALAAAVRGVVSLHDFRPHTTFRARPDYTSGSATLVAPADLATIYNLVPLFADGIAGQGQTIVLIEDSNLYSTSNWTTFRSTFGLSTYTSASLTEVHPAPSSGGIACTSPGVVANNEAEAALDVEWASAAAPGARIELASCADTATTFGGFIALENLVGGATPPTIVSISYAECEASNGAAANAAYASLYASAVAQGTSIFVAAGDSGAASCDDTATVATHGIGISAFASTPYDVAVGGTDFGDTYAGTTGSYWSGTNSASYGSALSYVPEVPWNDSCAGTLLTQFSGYAVPYGSGGLCNSASGIADYLTVLAASGGPSGCATGTPAQGDVVGGSCAGYAKPAWQAGLPGVPADGVRDIPDVALFAANGLWGHYYVYCDSDRADGGASCSGAPATWSGAGGTSFAAPIMAGIQALINQATGAKQGNPNPVYYAIAAAQSVSGGATACDATLGNAVASSCVFHDVTLGDTDLPCTGATGCYLPSGTYGVLSTSAGAYAPAYGAAPGWDFATGIGSINAENLVRGWNTSDLTLGVSGSATSAGLLSYTVAVGNAGPRSASGVVLTATLPAGASLVTASSSAGCTQAGQVVTCSIGALGIGANAPLTLVVQSATSSGTVDLSFALAATNGELFPASDTVATAVTIPPPTQSTGTTGSNVPLPGWTGGLLGLLVAGIGARRRDRSRPPR